VNRHTTEFLRLFPSSSGMIIPCFADLLMVGVQVIVMSNPTY